MTAKRYQNRVQLNMHCYMWKVVKYDQLLNYYSQGKVYAKIFNNHVDVDDKVSSTVSWLPKKISYGILELNLVSGLNISFLNLSIANCCLQQTGPIYSTGLSQLL